MQETGILLNELKNGDWWSRKNTIERLPVFNEGHYLPVLEEWLKKGDDTLLRNLATGAYKVVPAIVNALRRPGATWVILAKVLAISGEISHLLAFAADDNEEVRAAARFSLKNCGRISDNL